MKVNFQPNTKLSLMEKFPTVINGSFRPMVGDYIYSSYIWPCGFRLLLEVSKIYIMSKDEINIDIKVAMSHRWCNIREFYKFYEEITGESFL